jgi:hypothetical protein
LTYGFCSHELGKHINERVILKLDQSTHLCAHPESAPEFTCMEK